MKMHIAIVGPIATADVRHLIQGEATGLPLGYEGAPLLATLISELLRLGHRVSAFTHSADMPLNGGVMTAQGNSFSMNYIPRRPHAWRPNGLRLGRILDLYAFERKHLQRAIKQAAPDIVHAHWSYEFALAAIQTGLPNVVTCHDSPVRVAKYYSSAKGSQKWYRWLRVLMARKVMRRAHCLTAVSSYIRNEVQSMTALTVGVVPNPVDLAALALVKTRLAPSVPRFVMVCNGWQELKNPQPAMKAFSQFRNSYPKAELHLYGNDFGNGQMAEIWSKQHGISSGMIFHGSTPHKILLEELSKADILLHPALEESFGMSIAESMAMGLPVVAGEASGAVPWVVGNGGALCDVRQEKDILHAIGHVLVPDNYARFSAAASERVKAMFTASAVADAYLAIYKVAIDQRLALC